MYLLLLDAIADEALEFVLPHRHDNSFPIAADSGLCRPTKPIKTGMSKALNKAT